MHVPFCASTCDFCAFYQTKPSPGAIQAYLEAIAAEAALLDWPGRVATVFWGGGTPGLLSPRQLAKLAETVRARTGWAPMAGRRGWGLPPEWTVELAPASVTADRLAVLREAGVTRISMGVQSFLPARLEALGRQHTLAQVHRAYDRIRAAGFASVNLDLMFALPGQTEAEWAADVRAAVALAPEHLSTYCLTFEEDTALWVKLAQGRVKLDPEKEARLYEAGWAQLAAAGYEHYEVSNFARPGHACRHNLNTWHMCDWVGLGPSAASQHGGWRGANIADLPEWTARIGRGRRMTEDRVELTPGPARRGCADFRPAHERGRRRGRMAGTLSGGGLARIRGAPAASGGGRPAALRRPARAADAPRAAAGRRGRSGTHGHRSADIRGWNGLSPSRCSSLTGKKLRSRPPTNGRLRSGISAAPAAR